MFNLRLLFILVFAVACVQPPQTNLDTPLDDNSQDQTTNDPVEVNTTMSWNLSNTLSKVLELTPSANTNSFLFGDDVQNYLLSTDNFNSSFCFIAKYIVTGSVEMELRLRAIPSVTTDYSTGQQQYYFRINTANSAGNDFCYKSTSLAGTTTTTAPPGFGQVAYHVSEVCNTCSNVLLPSDVKFYKYNSSQDILDQVVTADLKSDDLRLQILYSSTGDNGGGSGSSCTDSSCNAQGFDCCIASQCVNNKALIKDPSEMTASELAEYNMAQAQSQVDPNWYLQYPNIYFICPNVVSDEGDDGDDTDGENQAEQELLQQISDYSCLQELETNATETPFHEFLINGSHTYTQCNTTDSTDNMYYETVMHRLYANCGCDASYTTLQDKVDHCPNYIYDPIYELDSLGNPTTNITGFNCSVLSNDDGPFGTQIHQVENNSAPHRFFNTDGVELDFDASPLASTNHNQEGSPFIYLDNDNIFPQNGSFNMNSILGQMYVSLDLAKPAKKISIDYDKQYYIAALDGYYTPCPGCAKDPWFGNFSANPISSQGFGLQTIGHTTQRDAFGTNTTLGNYGDTHFGRACFVPPTMLPYSHTENADAQTQRLNRLEAQASMFINGYQRDWYGFNHGALIGSFDGVTWFAIGNGRIVRSTTKSLYLAINAPYADLALSSVHNVSIQEWDGITTAPQVDFDPAQSLNSPFQNQGATCQENYLCEADSDCITKLGWEYSCIDVSGYSTKWPSFDTTTAAETANTSRAGNLYEFLQQAQMPSGSTKRCVYRGSGSICRTDSHNIADEETRRKLTCAPNFFCANINSAGMFNKEIARFGAPLANIVEANNHLYGRDANILGRPKHYIATGQGATLTATTRAVIAENVLLIDAGSSGKAGLCLPGKSLTTPDGSGNPSNYLPQDQHQNFDSSKRTDYISQIGGCHSQFVSDFKYSSCPILDDDGNYIHTKDDFLGGGAAYIDSILSDQARAQNSCGLESLHTSATISGTNLVNNPDSNNGFLTIEGKNLDEAVVTQPILAQNACLRRAGAVCHTNLDCSPNSKHAEVIDLLSPEFFGNEAEKAYWSESLICAQGTPEPNLGDADFNTYDITNNRCCRAIGNSITIYSEKDASDTDAPDINARTFASVAPNSANRYSRYSILSGLGDTELLDLDGNIVEYATPTANTDLTNPSNILVENQWKAINQTASKTCCGGGWIRKFADGTNDWSQSRLNLDISKFSCLNSKTPLTHVDETTASIFDSDPFFYNALQTDLGKFCYDSDRATGACSDQAFGDLNSLTTIIEPEPNNDNSVMKVYTLNTTANAYWPDADHDFSFFPPQSADAISLTYLNWNEDYTADTGQIRRNIAIKIPAYIPLNLVAPTTDFGPANLSQTITSVSLGQDGEVVCTPFNYLAGWYGMTDGTLTPSWAPATCAYTIDRLTRTMKIAYSAALTIENINPDPNNIPGQTYGNADDIFHAQIQYIAPGTMMWEKNNTALNTHTSNADIEHRRSSTPGNALYYLKKLEKLELIGIPQVTFEPIFCNNNYQKLVPGIFKDNSEGGVENINDIRNHSDFFEHTDTTKKPWDNMDGASTEDADLNRPFVTTTKILAHGEIFSSEEMMCCTPLGKETAAASQCCSGYAVQGDNGDNNLYCKLPSGVDLNVYFNKFVSNEGTDPNSGSAYLTDADFDAETGAPLLTTTVLQKLAQLGQDFCDSETTVRGGAFGEYRPQPVPPGQGSSGQQPIFNILDSFSDNGNNNAEPRGAIPFSAGKRWNHHVYCD